MIFFFPLLNTSVAQELRQNTKKNKKKNTMFGKRHVLVFLAFLLLLLT